MAQSEVSADCVSYQASTVRRISPVGYALARLDKVADPGGQRPRLFRLPVPQVGDGPIVDRFHKDATL